MKINLLAGLMALSALPATATTAAPAASAACRQLAAELAPRVAVDQALRGLSMQDEPAGPDGQPPKIWEQIGVVDRANTQFLKAFVRRCGWPGASSYGEKIVHQAWLLVQHADQDRAFQRHALRLIEQKVRQREVPPQNLAYLSDRVATAQGLPQLYGTQLSQDGDCELKPQAMDDPAAVDARRAKYGLQPLAEYLQQARQHILGPRCASKP